MPDLVLVWNEIQESGAQLYTPFSNGPLLVTAKTLRHLGRARCVIPYLYSSLFICAGELAFIKECLAFEPSKGALFEVPLSKTANRP
jgi:hypothetical protein